MDTHVDKLATRNNHPRVGSVAGVVEKGLRLDVFLSRRLKLGDVRRVLEFSRHVPSMEVDDRLCFCSSRLVLNRQSELEIRYRWGILTRRAGSPKLVGEGPRGEGEGDRVKCVGKPSSWDVSSMSRRLRIRSGRREMYKFRTVRRKTG